MSALTFILQVLGYDDVPPTSNPQSSPINYNLTQANLPFDNPTTESFNVDPGQSFLVWNGIRTTTVANDTAFDLTLNTFAPAVYRLTFAGGSDPGFRQRREVDLTGLSVTCTVLSNLSLRLVSDGVNPLSDVQVGDNVFMPGIKTGDPAGVFNDLNAGFWTVLSTPSTSEIILGRDPADTWEGASETVTPTAMTDFLAFSPDGVQVGDTVDIAAGFAAPVQRSFDITAVTGEWIEFLSTSPLGAESGVVPGADNFVIYTMRKRFVGIRTNQEIVVRYNGDTGSSNRVEPLLAGVAGMEGSDHKFGSVWSLEIFNRSTARAVVRVASAE